MVEHALATDDANAAFVNTYAHSTTSVVLGATKVLSGKALADGQFTFVLTAEDGTVYQAKNDAAGSVAFPALTFAEPGTYVYTISEVNDKQANVTYDTATYNVVVNVVDDGQGNLVATVAYDDGVQEFLYRAACSYAHAGRWRNDAEESSCEAVLEDGRRCWIDAWRGCSCGWACAGGLRRGCLLASSQLAKGER